MLSYILLLFSLLNFSTVLQSAKQIKVLSSGDIDLQTCVANFDVHTDKIIRTQDSRNMGAKYLNEMDLDSREECLRLCCETENCDVFVYEEKSTGSCYLFECGPPEDFKCKFTHHSNYTSAVLAISRHSSNLESQIKLTKHENDLTKLRASDVNTQSDVSDKNTTPTTIPLSTVQTKKTLTSTIKTNNHEVKENKDRKCSRYQFECKSSGECIAIYNACDGIVQCSDGSDEGSELNCPEISTTLKTQISNPLPQQQNIRYDHNNLNGERRDPAQYSQQQQYGAPYPKKPMQSLHNSEYNPEGDFLRPASSLNEKNEERQNFPYEDNNRPYPINNPSGTNDWSSRSSSKNQRVFNHVGNNAQINPIQHYSESESGVNYPQYYGDGYQNPLGYQSNQNWNLQQGHMRSNSYDIKKNNNPVNSNNWQTQKQIVSGDDNNDKFQSNQNRPLNSHEQSTTAQESENLAHDLKNSKNFMPKIENENKAKEVVKNKNSLVNGVQAYKTEKDDVVKYHIKNTEDFDDGFAETPSGAALSLTLGLILTCVMAILIACRLRKVRRRMRKGGKGYAHDADYLVNGMYL